MMATYLKQKRVLQWLVASWIAAWNLAGCDDTTTCTLAQFYDTLTIHTDSQMWLDGTYAVELVAENFSWHCTFDVPPPELADAGVGDDPQPAECTLMSERSGYDFAFSSLGANGLTLALTLPSVPRDVQLRITEGSDVLVDTVRRPSYEIDEPNGPGCWPRHSAELPLHLPR